MCLLLTKIASNVIICIKGKIFYESSGDMEYIIALIPAIAWGLIGIIAKKAGGKPEQQTIGSLVGFLFFAGITYLFIGPSISIQILIVGFISGSCLAMANFGQFDAMQDLGVSRTVPLVAAGQLVLNNLVAAILFKEWTSINQWFFGIIALIIIIMGAKFTSFQDSSIDYENELVYTKKGLKGVFICVVAGSLYSIVPKAYQYYFINNIKNDYVYALMLPQAIGGIVLGSIIYRLKIKKTVLKELTSKYMWRNTLTGLSWSVGNLFLLISSTSSIGLAVAFTLSQLNIIVGGLLGSLILKEEKTIKEMRFFLLGIVLVLTGAIISTKI